MEIKEGAYESEFFITSVHIQIKIEAVLHPLIIMFVPKPKVSNHPLKEINKIKTDQKISK